MQADALVDLGREALVLALLLSLPILAAAFAAGLTTAILQALTRLSEPVLTHVPRIVAVGLAAVFAAPWISERVAVFAEKAFALVHTLP